SHVSAPANGEHASAEPWQYASPAPFSLHVPSISLQSNVERFAPSQTCTLPLSTEQNASPVSSGAHFESAWHAGVAVLHTRPSFAQTVVTIKFSSHADATPFSHFGFSSLHAIEEQRANGSIWR